MRKNQNGFSAAEALVIIFILGILSFCVWLFWQKANDNSADGKSSSQVQKKDINSSSKVTLKQYKNVEYGVTFSYPSNWKINEDIEDIGRGYPEGDVTITSPNDTKVTFNFNQGGKGGDCWDDSANTRTARTCTTRTILSVEQISKISSQPVYFFTASAKQAEMDGSRTTYYVGLASDFANSEAPLLGSSLVDIANPGVLGVKNGDINVRYSGKDDDSNSSKSFLQSEEIKEVTTILKTFTVN